MTFRLNGARCEALYEYVCTFTATQIRPNQPADG